MKKRWMSLLLALAMIVTMIPTVNVQAAQATLVNLGAADFLSGDSTKVQFKEVEVTGIGAKDVHTILVSVAAKNENDEGKVAIHWPDDKTPSLTDRAGESGNRTAAWINNEGWNAAEVEAFIKSLSFTYVPEMSVNVTLDCNEITTDIPNDATLVDGNIYAFDGHYYMYVPYNKEDNNNTNLTDSELSGAKDKLGYAESSWTQAYDKAKNITFMGMPGYLATITSTDEVELLQFISAKKAGWVGATLLVRGDGNATKINNESTIANFRAGLVLPESPGPADAKPEDNRNLYYWACGPEAGRGVTEAAKGKNLWDEKEPNFNSNPNNKVIVVTAQGEQGGYLNGNQYETCAIANYYGNPWLNDIKEGNYNDPKVSSGTWAARAFGYFVEFSVYGDDNSDLNRSTKNVTLNLLNLKGKVNHGTIEGEQSISKTISANSACTAEVKADGGYRVPTAEEAAKYINVKVGGKTLTPSQYTWTPSTTKDSDGFVTSGMITITDNLVTGDVEIVVDCIQKPPYTLTEDVQNGTYTGKTGEKAVELGKPYTATIAANPNYELPDDITVTIAGRKLDPTEYTYNSTNGSVTIPGDKIIGDVDIKAVCTPVKYTVKGTVTGGTFPGGGTTINGTIEAGKEYTTTITPNTKDGYELPGADGVEVKVNGQKLTKSQYIYDPDTGKITIPGSSVTGNVEITAVCPKDDGKYTVTDQVKNGDFDGEDTVEKGDDYTATITPDDGYKLPDSIKVYVGGKEISDDDYTWNPKTGKVYIPDSSITGNVKIVATCTKDVYTAKGKITNGSFDGDSDADPGKSYTATITPDDGYDLPDKITVKVNGKTLSDDDYTWDPKTGKVKIKGAAVTGDIVISAVCTKKSSSGSGSGSGSGTTSGGSGTGSATPKTGDSMNIMLYVILMLVAVGGFAGCGIYRRKLQRKE